MDAERRQPVTKIDPDEGAEHDIVDLQEQVMATKAQGERLLEESRSLQDMSRALLDEIDPSTV
jgi:hypothetical protein